MVRFEVVPLPRWIARFNKRATNRFIEPIARRSPGFAVVHHRGRRSGRSYSTPVNLFRIGDDAVVALTYGPSADWVRNVQASGGMVTDRTGRQPIGSTRVVNRAEVWSALPAVVRGPLRIMRVDNFLLISLGLDGP